MTYTEIEVEYLNETDHAVLVSWERSEAWIPKSCIDYGSGEFQDDFFDEGEYFVISIVDWKIKELGWGSYTVEI